MGAGSLAGCRREWVEACAGRRWKPMSGRGLLAPRWTLRGVFADAVQLRWGPMLDGPQLRLEREVCVEVCPNLQRVRCASTL